MRINLPAVFPKHIYPASGKINGGYFSNRHIPAVNPAKVLRLENTPLINCRLYCSIPLHPGNFHFNLPMLYRWNTVYDNLLSVLYCSFFLLFYHSFLLVTIRYSINNIRKCCGIKALGKVWDKWTAWWYKIFLRYWKTNCFIEIRSNRTIQWEINGIYWLLQQ